VNSCKECVRRSWVAYRTQTRGVRVDRDSLKVMNLNYFTNALQIQFSTVMLREFSNIV
jgi:hypothetical protein